MRKKVEMSELTKGTLLGDKHACGFVSLFEYKHQVLNHWITVVVPRAKILEKDRVAFNEHWQTTKRASNICGAMIWLSKEACNLRPWTAWIFWRPG